MENLTELITYIIFSTAFFFWILYVCKSSYPLISSGLKSAYRAWLLHLIYMVFDSVVFHMRPIWTQEPDPLIYESNVRCKILGYLNALSIAANNFLITFFTFSKARIYFKFYHPNLLPYFTAFIWAGLIPDIGYVISVRTGKTEVHGDVACLEQSKVSYFCLILMILHWLIANLNVVFVFWRYAHFLNDSFPDLEFQLTINRRYVPMLFVTSAFFLVITFWFYEKSLIFWGYMCHILDQFLNQMLMHYTLYGYSPAQSVDEDDPIRRRIEMMTFENENPTIQVGLEVEDYALGTYWVDLPGVMPVEVTHEIVAKHELWGNVIEDKRVLRQMQTMQRNCFFGEICRTTEDLLRHRNTIVE